jgi:ABC-type transporter MlaC component
MSKTLTILFTLFIAASLGAQEANKTDQASGHVTAAVQQQLDELRARMDAATPRS